MRHKRPQTAAGALFRGGWGVDRDWPIEPRALPRSARGWHANGRFWVEIAGYVSPVCALVAKCCYFPNTFKAWPQITSRLPAPARGVVRGPAKDPPRPSSRDMDRTSRDTECASCVPVGKTVTARNKFIVGVGVQTARRISEGRIGNTLDRRQLVTAADGTSLDNLAPPG
jgi:hypothetical protein